MIVRCRNKLHRYHLESPLVLDDFQRRTFGNVKPPTQVRRKDYDSPSAGRQVMNVTNVKNVTRINQLFSIR